MARITQRHLDSLKPASRDQFIRDAGLTGFGVKVTPKGKISFFAEGRIKGGRTRRITLGKYPILTVAKARASAREHLQMMQSGQDPVLRKKEAKAKEAAMGRTLGAVFDAYMKARDHKPRTAQDYRNTFNLIFAEWKDRPIRQITRRDAENLFVDTRDNRGLPQAAKAFRIVSAVFNFAMADEVQGKRLITENPADVIKQKKYRRTVKPRESFLSEDDISALIHYYHKEKDWPETPEHGATDQGINFVMFLLATGLRKSEALKLRWKDVDERKGCLVVHDTKNNRDHYVPLSTLVDWILGKQRVAIEKQGKGDSPWVFPARHGDGHMTEPKSQLKAICDYTGIKFTFHDLRRTFATHAQVNGVSYDLIQRALNHKSRSVTEGYLITQIDTLRPVFEAVADGYHTYYEPDWKEQVKTDNALAEHAID